MTTHREPPTSIDDYIAKAAPEVRAILERIRALVQAAAPGATEAIQYQMPTFVEDGALIHFAAFAKHIGLYPPVRGNAALEKAVAPYAGPKGNLRFPLDRPIPYALIERIVRYRADQNTAKRAATKAVKSPAKRAVKAPAEKAAKSPATKRGART